MDQLQSTSQETLLLQTEPRDDDPAGEPTTEENGKPTKLATLTVEEACDPLDIEPDGVFPFIKFY